MKILVFGPQDRYAVYKPDFVADMPVELVFRRPDQTLVEAARENADAEIIFTDAITNNNIVFTSTAKTDEFDDITAEEFESQMNAATAQTGVSISGAVVTEGKNANKIKITKVTYTATVAAEGVQVSMGQTMLVFTVGEKTYTVTVTEAAPDVTLAGIVFDSINKGE